MLTTYNIQILGDLNVGKTTITKNIFFNDKCQDVKKTLGVEYYSKFYDDILVKLNIWDHGGDECYLNITHSYIRKCDIFIIVFDLSDINSFQKVNNWFNLIKDNCITNYRSILIGNKSDINTINKSVVSKFIKENDIIYFKCNSITNENIKNVYNYIFKIIKPENYNKHKHSFCKCM